MKKIIISNREDIINIINNYNMYLESNEEYETIIENLLPFELYIIGEKYEGYVNCDMLQSILYLQTTINKIYCYIKYDNSDIRKLTKQDKEKLELKIKIQKGSIDISSSLDNFLNELIKQMATKMNSKEILIIVCVISSCFLCNQIFKMFFNTKLKQLENEKETTLKQLENEKETTLKQLENEKEDNLLINFKSIVDATLDNQYNKIANFTKRECENMYLKMLKKSYNYEEGIKINGYKLYNKQILELIKNEKNIEDTLPIRLDGKYKIIDVNFNNEEEYKKIELECLENNSKFISKNTRITTYLYEDLLATNMKDISIKLTDKNIIYNFKINAELIDNKIDNAYIVDIMD